MSKSTILGALALAAAWAAVGPAFAADPPGYERLAVTNTTERIAYCTLLFDGRARTELAIRPGKTWYEAFAPGRDLRLVCQRSKQLYFGPLAPGKSYRLVPVARSKLDVAEGSAE
jgi:hypothetical protein